MARLRTLKPSFFTHDLLAELSPLHRLLFQGLWCHADREGRLEDRPRYLKTVILPYDDCDVDSMLGDLSERGFVLRYVVDDQRLLWVPKFLSHQKPHKREGPSKLPPPPKQARPKPARTAPPQDKANPSTIQADSLPDPGTTQALPEHDLGSALNGPEHDLGSAQAQPRPDPGTTLAVSEHDLKRDEPGGLLSFVFGLKSESARARSDQHGVGVEEDVGEGHGAAAFSPVPPPKARKAKTPQPDVAAMRDAWNEAADSALPRWETRPAGREKAAAAFLKKRDLTDWCVLIARVSASDYLCGRKPGREFRASVDWLLKPANLAKVLEGNYDDMPAPQTAARAVLPPTPLAEACALCGAQGVQSCKYGAGDGLLLCYERCAPRLEAASVDFRGVADWVAQAREADASPALAGAS